MADDGLIAAYLRELAFSVGKLADADDIVAEAEDHLREASARMVASGHSEPEAEAEAIARFGSAELISRVCAIESKRGASVPTTKTRRAGLALLLSPVLVAAGQWGNLTIEEGQGHGIAVLLLCLGFPAFLYGLWGLRERQGGLGRLGKIAFRLALLSPILSLPLGYGQIYGLAAIVGIAVVMFAVEMLRAGVLPTVPIALIIVGPIALLLVLLPIGVLADAGDVPGLLLAAPIALMGVGFVWLGSHLWSETAVNSGTRATPRAVLS